MRYEDLDGVSKFQMKYFEILMLKIEKDSEDFISIDKLAEKIEQSYIVEKTPEWITLRINEVYRICFILNQKDFSYSVKGITDSFQIECGTTKNPFACYTQKKEKMDRNWVDYCKKIEKKKIEIDNRIRKRQKTKKRKEIENAAIYALLKNELGNFGYEWEYFPKSSRVEIYEGRNILMSIELKSSSDPIRNVVRIKKIFEDKARYEKENGITIRTLCVKFESREN